MGLIEIKPYLDYQPYYRYCDIDDPIKCKKECRVNKCDICIYIKPRGSWHSNGIWAGHPRDLVKGQHDIYFNDVRWMDIEKMIRFPIDMNKKRSVYWVCRECRYKWVLVDEERTKLHNRIVFHQRTKLLLQINILGIKYDSSTVYI